MFRVSWAVERVAAISGRENWKWRVYGVVEGTLVGTDVGLRLDRISVFFQTWSI